MRHLWIVLLVPLAVGCARGDRQSAAEVKPKPIVRAEPWAAVSLAPTGPPAYLANSRLGLRISHSGLGCAPDGTSMPAFLMSNNSLLRIPHPASMQVWIDERSILSDVPTQYESRLDFRTGLLETNSKFDDLAVRIETIVHAQSPRVAQRVTLSSPRKRSLKIWIGVPTELANLSGDSPASWSDFTLECPAKRVSSAEAKSLGEPEDVLINFRSRWSEAPNGSWSPSRSSPKSTVSGRGFLFEGELPAGTVVFETTSSVGSNDSKWFDGVVSESREVWNDRWSTDIEIEGPVEDQQAIRSFLFYLYMSPTSKMPPMALSSDKYSGHRFWDAEAWMLPAYVLIRPAAAKGATDWRILVSDVDARIPWETGSVGDDMTPPEFREAIHISGWVSWWLDKAIAFGLVDRSAALPLIRSIAEYFRERVTDRNGQLELLSVVSPDEGKLRDNDLVTNLLAIRSGEILAKASGGESQLTQELARIKIPTNRAGDPMTYDSDPVSGYQQAAAVLSIFPLEWPFPRPVSEKLFDRYRDKITPHGPAMSDSIHAVIAARLGRKDEAYNLWQDSWRPFVRPEFMLFSERRGTDDVYFATGAAGCLLSVLYGFLGIHIEKDEGQADSASKPLLYGYRLSVRPNLPPQWKSITLKNVRLPGGRFTIRATHNGAEILPGGE